MREHGTAAFHDRYRPLGCPTLTGFAHGSARLGSPAGNGGTVLGRRLTDVTLPGEGVAIAAHRPRALAVFGMLGAHLGAVPDDVQASPSGRLGAVNGRSSSLFACRPYQGPRGCPLHL